jgi:hypothetical protein
MVTYGCRTRDQFGRITSPVAWSTTTLIEGSAVGAGPAIGSAWFEGSNSAP